MRYVGVVEDSVIELTLRSSHLDVVFLETS